VTVRGKERLVLKLPKGKTLLVVVVLVLAVTAFQASVVLAQPPMPNPLAPIAPGGNSQFAPVPGVDLTKSGPAASIHGDPARGRPLFAANCAACHNDRGLGNVPNSGSNDGTVPPLNPIDPGFLEQSQGDPAKFVQPMDLFLQHGSRPAGESPQFSMIPWGDQMLLSQQAIADVEAYVMQLNGVYWPDRWAPPVDVQMKANLDATQNEVTYEITLVNESASVLSVVDLTDALPPGLSYVSSDIENAGGNPGKVTAGHVEWNNPGGVPQGGALGPFIIRAKIQGDTIPANVAEVSFAWSSWDGTLYRSTAVSNPTLPAPPATPKPAPAAPASSAPVGSPTATAAAVGATPTPVAPVAATPAAIPPSTASGASGQAPTATAAATEVPATATPIAATPTPVPAVPAPASLAVQIVQPGASAMSWGYAPPSITIHVGDTIVWSNDAANIAHTVTSDSGAFDSGTVNAGATWTFTFNTAGTFTYHCTPHPWMKGTVVVQGS
jgi:uncharacterized repeat protein (TIGR01451 family)